MDSSVVQFGVVTAAAFASLVLPFKSVDQWNVPARFILNERFDLPSKEDARKLWLVNLLTLIVPLMLTGMIFLLSLLVALVVDSLANPALWRTRYSNGLALGAAGIASAFLAWPLRYFVAGPLAWGKEWKEWVAFEIGKIEKSLHLMIPFQVDPLKFVMGSAGLAGLILTYIMLVLLPDSYAGLTPQGAMCNPIEAVGTMEKHGWEDAEAFFIVTRPSTQSTPAPFHVVYFKTGRWDNRNLGYPPEGAEFGQVSEIIMQHSKLMPVQADTWDACEALYAQGAGRRRQP